MSQELPLPDYDSLPVGSIESRVKTLGRQASVSCSITRGNTRTAGFPQHGEAEPTEGSPLASAPVVSSGLPGGSKASQANEAPPRNPPSHGDPTNPAEPRG
jgi:hypothetical protein